MKAEINANDNRKGPGRCSHSGGIQSPRVEIDCWLEGGAPYLVSVFDPFAQPEPLITEIFEEAGEAFDVALGYAEKFGITHVYDLTGEVA